MKDIYLGGLQTDSRCWVTQPPLHHEDLERGQTFKRRKFKKENSNTIFTQTGERK